MHDEVYHLKVTKLTAQQCTWPLIIVSSSPDDGLRGPWLHRHCMIISDFIHSTFSLSPNVRLLTVLYMYWCECLLQAYKSIFWRQFSVIFVPDFLIIHVYCNLLTARQISYVSGESLEQTNALQIRFPQLLASSYISKSNSNPLPFNFANTSFSNLSFSSGVK